MVLSTSLAGLNVQSLFQKGDCTLYLTVVDSEFRFLLEDNRQLSLLPCWMNDLFILDKTVRVLGSYPSITLTIEQIYLYFTGNLFAHICFKNEYAAMSSLLEAVAGEKFVYPHLIQLAKSLISEYRMDFDPFMWVRAGLPFEENVCLPAGLITRDEYQEFFARIAEVDDLILSLSSKEVQRFVIECQLFTIIDSWDFNSFNLREKVALAYILVRVKTVSDNCLDNEQELQSIFLVEIGEAVTVACQKLWRPGFLSFLNKGLQKDFKTIVWNYLNS